MVKERERERAGVKGIFQQVVRRISNYYKLRCLPSDYIVINCLDEDFKMFKM